MIPEPLNSTLVSEAIETVFPASAAGTNEPKPRTATRERVARGRKEQLNFFIGKFELHKNRFAQSPEVYRLKETYAKYFIHRRKRRCGEVAVKTLLAKCEAGHV